MSAAESEAPGPADALVVRDALQRELRLPGRPQRIVSLVPSLSSFVVDLGLRAGLVGVTRFCVEPEGLKEEKAVIGGTKDVLVERVLALEPDLVLANEEENVREQVDAIAEHVPVYVTRVATVEDDLAMVRALGDLLGASEQAEALAQTTARAFAELPAYAPLRTLYLIWREPFMSVGDDTFIHDVLARCALVNVCAGQQRYPSLSPGELVDLAPEVVLLSSEPYPFKAKHLAELRELLPRAQVELVSGEPFSWYGSRVASAPAYLRALRERLSAGRR